MTDRTELLEAAFDSLPDGMGLFGEEDEVVFWSQAAHCMRIGCALAALPLALGVWAFRYSFAVSSRWHGRFPPPSAKMQR